MQSDKDWEKDQRMQPLSDLEALALEAQIEQSLDGRTLGLSDESWANAGLPHSEVDTALLILGYHKRWVTVREENRRLRMFAEMRGGTNG